MIDLKLLVNDFEAVAKKLSKRNMDATLLGTLRETSLNYKERKIALEELQAQQNAKTKLFAKVKQEGGDVESLKAECDMLKAKIELYAKELELWENNLKELTYAIPNIPDSKTP